ncbi:MAG: ABC transporter permease subunit [Treponema sp.]|jgi:NitT/TauT family transport system permease protein|nr:ABC transporter permease subunit [Treponema sp.]
MRFTIVRKNIVWISIGIAALLVAWATGATITGSEILFPTPVSVIKRFFALAHSARFFQALFHSFLRVLLGMAISAPLGIAVGVIAGLDTRAASFFQPLFTLVSATPVMSVILIAFLLMGADRTPIFTAFLMVFPVMAANTLEGIRSVDPRLTEVFSIYPVSLKIRLHALYIPTLIPFITGSLRASLSLCWKVVAAAEVLVQPARALGTSMQMAKAQLETAELFAWTLATILAAALSQLLLHAFFTFWYYRNGFHKYDTKSLL